MPLTPRRQSGRLRWRAAGSTTRPRGGRVGGGCAARGNTVASRVPPAAKPRVAGLWETVDEGAGFDEVLDALISGGLRDPPPFAPVRGEGRDGQAGMRRARQAG